jgi:hypothetical protein
VVDANALIEDVVHVARHGRSLLTSLAADGTIALFVPPHILAKVELHAERVAGQTGVDIDKFLQLWRERYLAHLRIVSLPPLNTSIDRRLSAVPDLEDVPVAQLSVLLAPCLLVTRDKHLLDAGLGQANWADSLVFVAKLAKLDAQLFGGVQAAILFSTLAAMGVVELGKLIVRSSVGTTVALVVAMAVASDWRPGSGAFVARARRQIATTGRSALNAMAAFVDEREAAGEHLGALLVEATPTAGLAEFLAPRLAVSRHGIAVHTLALVARAGGLKVSESQVLAELSAHPSFEELEHRWHVGCRASAGS